MNRHRTRSVVILTIGFALAVSPMSIASASQNASTSKHGDAKTQSGSHANFCSYYASAGDIYGSDQGEFDHEDPAMKRMVIDFEKAQALAPTASLKKSVTAMLKLTKADLTAKNPNKVSFSRASRPVSKWGDAHCPSSESAAFDSFESSGSSGTSASSGNTGSSTQGKASLTAFCKDVQAVTRDVTTLLATSKDGGTEVSASLLSKTIAAAQHLANEAPSSVKQDAEALVKGLKSPNSANADPVGASASLQTDYDTDCPGGVAYTGGSGNSGNSGGFGNSGNSGGFGNSGNSGGFGNSGNSGGFGNSGNS